jgi:hypothetical protein
VNPVILEKLADFDLSLYQPIYARQLELGESLAPAVGNLVKAVVGMRRSGKSFRLFQEMQSLINAGVSSNRICYFNFEDDRLSPVTSQTGDELLEAFELQNPGAQTDGFYLFLDEIQVMDNWDTWLRRIVDTKRVTIYVTGSSSQMLSSEISTKFRGRAISVELLPLSFAEYLAFHKIEVPKTKISASVRIRLQAAFAEYLKIGGFPAVQSLPRAEAISLLQTYAQRVVASDVIERHNLTNPRATSVFAQRLLGLNGRELSLRKTLNDMQSAGIKTSRAYIADVLEYIQASYMIFALKELKYSLAAASNARSKIYAVDPGLALANGSAYTNDAGQRLENAVYLELRRRAVGICKDAITFMRTAAHGYEVDFVVSDALVGNATELYQVCERVDDEKTLSRELRALWEALEERDLQEATLIVAEGQESQYEQAGKVIWQIPAWKWFLRL